MDTKPCVLIASNNNTKPKSLIQLITKEKVQDGNNELVEHPWVLDTKYYTAEINFVGITNDFDRSEKFNENVEALILHFDANKTNGLNDLKEWESIENDCEPDIKLLIANYCHSQSKISKSTAIDWCLKRGYEFVELYPEMTEQADDQDIIPEKFGADRIVESLQAHVWTNLKMKSEEEKEQKVSTTNSYDTSEQIGDDFSELFDKLHVMKESIQSLPMKERKHCAEQVVMAFWKAIGGDEDEIGDL